VKVQTGFTWTITGSAVLLYKHGNETSGSINTGTFINQLSDDKLLRKNCILCSSSSYLI
jgi:hypothetical protein